MVKSLGGHLVKTYFTLCVILIITTCTTLYICINNFFCEVNLKIVPTSTRARNSNINIKVMNEELFASIKKEIPKLFNWSNKTKKALKLETNEKPRDNIPEQFKFSRQLFRPALKNLSTPFDFDEYFDDRIHLQREWIVHMTTARAFRNLKPKRVLVEFGALPEHLELDGALHCDKHKDSLWEKKCVFEMDPPEMNWNDSEAQANRNLDKYDAVIETRHWFEKEFVRKIPKSSSVKQILVSMESPFLTGLIDFSLNNALLASYWRGSDISIPYSKWVPLQEGKNFNSNLPPKNYAEGKTKLAAIVVSNCEPNNARLRYVRELLRHVEVDIYGKCGNLNCSEDCLEDLGARYKFYLAFENSNCRDYITEKVFRNALGNNMVPVVLGAEMRDYLYALPPNSFIHVEDFDTPLELTEYLKQVDKNDKLYNEFFRWKNMGKFVEATNDLFCRACALLHIADFVEPPIWPKGSTWDKVNVCLPKGRWYWHRPNPKLEEPDSDYYYL